MGVRISALFALPIDKLIVSIHVSGWRSSFKVEAVRGDSFTSNRLFFMDKSMCFSPISFSVVLVCFSVPVLSESFQWISGLSYDE